MTPEQRAAAERVRKVWGKGWTKQKPWYATYGDDCESLACAFLDEHPADDDEPVTLEWIRATYPLTRGDKWMIDDGDERTLLFFEDFPKECNTTNVCVRLVHPEWGWLCVLKTRGQLRALLKGLGQ